MKPYPGQDWHKWAERWEAIAEIDGQLVERYEHGSRLAQCSGVDDEYAYMYWPDKDTETRVRLKRFNRKEWEPV